MDTNRGNVCVRVGSAKRRMNSDSKREKTEKGIEREMEGEGLGGDMGSAVKRAARSPPRWRLETVAKKEDDR